MLIKLSETNSEYYLELINKYNLGPGVEIYYIKKDKSYRNNKVRDYVYYCYGHGAFFLADSIRVKCFCIKCVKNRSQPGLHYNTEHCELCAEKGNYMMGYEGYTGVIGN